MADEILKQELLLIINDAEVSMAEARKILDSDGPKQRAVVRQLKARMKDHVRSFEKFNPAKGKPDTYEYGKVILPILMQTRYTSMELEELSEEMDRKEHPAPRPAEPTRVLQPISRSYDIVVPTFNGEHDDYPRFREAFRVAIHESHMSAEQKMILFRDKLAPNVRTRIEAIPVSTENYERVLKIIDDIYQDESRIIQSLYIKLQNVEPADDTTKSLRKTHDTLEAILRALERHEVDLENHFINNIIVQKIPEDILYNFAKKKGELTVKVLREELADMLIIRERICAKKEAAKPTQEFPAIPIAAMVAPNQPPTTKPPQQFKTAAGDGKPAKRERFKKDSKGACVFCKEAHLPEDCGKFKSAKERFASLGDRACLLCLRTNHTRAYCRAKTDPCRFCEKKRAHHTALCHTKFGYIWDKKEVSESSSTTKVVGVFTTSSDTYLLAVARIFNPVTHENCYARIILDHGAGRTYILEQTAAQLNLQPFQRQRQAIGKFNSDKIDYLQTAKVLLRVDELERDIVAETIPLISNHVPSLDIRTIQRRYPKLRVYDFVKQGSGAIDLLIGGDYYYHFFTSQPVSEVIPDIFVVHTIFGPMLSGKIENAASTRPVSAMVASQTQAATLKLFWDLEVMGIRDPATKEASSEDLAISQFDQNIRKVQGRYSVSLPWKHSHPSLPNNYVLAKNRLFALLRQHSRAQHYLAACDRILKQQIVDGIVERVDNSIQEDHHYIPFHFVFTPEKSTPLRIVYDASARCRRGAPSLNDCLLKGVNTTPKVPSMLIGFRRKAVAIVGDIKHAFHTVAIHENNRDSLRFLWTSDYANPSRDNLITLRFARVPFGVISSGFLLAATIAHHLNNSKNELAHTIKNSLYIDDFIASVDSDDEAIKMILTAVDIFGDAGMRLHKWVSNRPSLAKRVGEDLFDQRESTKVLGISWDTANDTLTFPAPEPFDFEKPVTKRRVLSAVAQVFDPLCYLSPVTINARIFMQTLHREKTSWNAQISAENLQEWKKIYTQMAKLGQIAIKRHLGGPNIEPEFHVCTDASAKAYAAVVFARYVEPISGSSQVRIIMAKSRVAPLETVTIPRLELLSIQLGTRLLKSVREAFSASEQSRAIVWSDSTVSLDWIASNNVLPTFVQNRVNEIRLSPTTEFRHIPGRLNPADLPSRGISTKELMEAKEWWNGPIFLSSPESEWPPTYVPSQPSINPGPNDYTTVNLAPLPDVTSPFSIDHSKFNYWGPLQRITAYCIAYTRGLHLRVNKKRIAEGKQPFPTLFAAKRACTDLARVMWAKYLQKRHYAEIFEDLKTKKKHYGLIRDLRLFIDQDGLIRTRGRFFNATNIPANLRTLILLPKATRSRLTKLIILNVHMANMHVGTNHTLSALRRQFWIPAGRQQIFAAIRTCTACSRERARPYKQPSQSDLPAERFKVDALPFTCIGLDVAGHFFVVGAKRWILLVTCLVTRAVALEVLEDMTTASFALAYRRIAARHTHPGFMLSDKAPQFILLQSYLHRARVTPFEWKNTVDYAPWQGATYERLVALMKTTLYRSLCENPTSTDTQFRTLVAEIEGVLNDRPLTATTEHLDIRPLTPNHFLKITREEPNDDIVIPNQISEPARKLNELWKFQNVLQDRVRNIWVTEYLNFLRERSDTQNFKRRTNTFIPKVGDVVLVEDKNQKRKRWNLAVVFQLQVSADGQIRSCVVRLPSGVKIIRPIQALYYLEMNELEDPNLNAPAT